MSFKVVDGANRVRALHSLIEDPSVLFFNSNTRITVEVARETRSVVQLSLDAAAESAKNTREFPKKTFNDDLWAMIGIQEEAVRQLVASSTAVAEQPDAEVVHDPDPAVPTRRKGSSRKVTPLLSLPNLPEEGAGFIETYFSSIYSHLVVNKSRVQPYRRPLDPEAKKDRDLLYLTVLFLVLLALLADSHDVSLSSVLSVKNEGVKCKWPLLPMILFRGNVFALLVS
jgi:hypothetical protein